MKRILFGVFIILLVSLIITNAEAKDSSIYFGIGGGSAQFNGDVINDVIFLSGQKLDDDTGYYNIYFGYQLNKYLSFEVGYADFGRVSKKYSLNPDITSIVAPNDTISIESNGFTISSLLVYPISEKFSVFGTIGFSYLDVDSDVYLGSTGPGTNMLSYSSSNSEGDILYGIGLRYKMSDHLKIRIQWEHYNIDASDTIVSPSLEAGIEPDVFGVSLEYFF